MGLTAMLFNPKWIVPWGDFILKPESGFIAIEYLYLNLLFLIMPLLETRDQSQLQRIKSSVFQATLAQSKTRLFTDAL